jgi:hypothetical protein
MLAPAATAAATTFLLPFSALTLVLFHVAPLLFRTLLLTATTGYSATPLVSRRYEWRTDSRRL